MRRHCVRALAGRTETHTAVDTVIGSLTKVHPWSYESAFDDKKEGSVTVCSTGSTACL